MLKRKENLKYEDFVAEYKINSYDKLLSFFQESDENPDLRENYIFRGLSDYGYDLIPSSLRKYKNGDYKISDYINNDFKLLLNTKMEYQKEDGTKGRGLVSYCIDKNNEISNEISDRSVGSFDEVQFKREISVLLHFLDYSDKIGLKIFAEPSIRKWIHSYLAYENKFYETWPKEEFFEIISLAQHHGLPTRALDWSYDYKVSLYFAIKNVLKEEEKHKDCVLWAFNYKIFENNHIMDSENIHEDFVIYRPEYNSNSNLKAQRGLFTFVVSKQYDNMDKEEYFDEFIINKLINSVDEHNKELYFKLDGFKPFKIPDNVKIFYKFIIPGNIKAKILYNLYLDGYGTEEIYPNYKGVVDSIKNRVKLEKILNQNK